MHFHFIYYPLYMIIMQVYPDSGRTSWFRSTSQLWMSLLTSIAHHDSSQWARSLSYHPSYERLRMARIDDCNILQSGHLVGNGLGGTHDSISIQNLRSHSFTCRSSQTMCHATKEHLACHDLRKIWVSGGTRYPTTLEDQCLRMSGHTSS
jgi:hypothetical protein